MDKIKEDFISVFGGEFMYSEPGYDLLYLPQDNDVAYITPTTGLDLLINESLASTKNLIVERCPTLEYDPNLVY